MVAYASDRGNGKNLDLWVHPLTPNAQPIRITTNDADDSDPEFSPDGGQIAFHSRRDGGGLYVVPALGGQDRLLIRGGGLPRYSPDGKWLAYSTSFQGHFLQDSQVMVMPATGGPPRRMAVNLAWSSRPVWSPDSSSVFLAGRKAEESNDSWTIWRAPVDGGPATQIAVEKLLPFTYVYDSWGDSMLISSRGIRAFDPVRGGVGDPLFTTTGAISGVRAAAGKIAFTSAPPQTTRLWSVAIDHDTARLRGSVEPLLHASGSQSMPAITFNGSKLLYTHYEPARSQLRLRDMVSGAETVLHPAYARGKISPDGSKVAFSDFRSIFLVDSAGGEPTRLDIPRGTLFGWTFDGKSLVYYDGSNHWFTFDLAAGKSTPFSIHPKLTIHTVEFSPDRRWVAFSVPGGVREPLYIAPVQGASVADEPNWVRVADAAGINRRPWWSPNGNLLYWISEHDGFRCVWARRLDPVTRKPEADPFAVLHFHEAQRTTSGGNASFGPAVSRDRLIVGLSEVTGNIWIAEPEKQP
jgi:Tol biopolymer transport system component